MGEPEDREDAARLLAAQMLMQDGVASHAQRREIDAIARLAEVATRKYVTASTRRAALDRHPSIRRRSLLVGLIDDMETGTHSVLERISDQGGARPRTP